VALIGDLCGSSVDGENEQNLAELAELGRKSFFDVN
jgi:hypothetical protein